MEISQIIPHVEVLIFASEKPLTNAELLEMVNNALGFIEDQAVPDQVAAAIEAIREKYASEFYPFEVRESGGGWQFLTKKDYHKTVALINGDKFLKRLSAAALETLAIIAYKQPITKGEIEAIRGVSSDYSIQKLLEKELIIISGRNEDMPGKPLVYATSKTFMDYFGINSPADLPKLKEVFAETLVEATVVHHSGEVLPMEGLPAEEGADQEENIAPLLVSEEGELLEGADFGTETDEQADENASAVSSYSGEGEETGEATEETGTGETTSESDEEGDDEAAGFPEEQTAGEGEDPADPDAEEHEDPDHPDKN